nr:PREDICTED: SRSF protein kinase 3-like [Opisthocomus hoazin]
MQILQIALISGPFLRCQDVHASRARCAGLLTAPAVLGRWWDPHAADVPLCPLTQVLAGLHFLHKRCRIIHADIKPENILLCGRDKTLQRLLPDTLDCGQRTDLRLEGPGGDLGNQLEESDLMSIEVKIADLGSACWTYKPFSKEIQTQPYRALEVLLGLDYGTPADIWSMGCLAFEMATGECLFDPQPGKYFSRDDDHVARIIELLGRIPPQIALSWNKSTKFFSRPDYLLPDALVDTQSSKIPSAQVELWTALPECTLLLAGEEEEWSYLGYSPLTFSPKKPASALVSSPPLGPAREEPRRSCLCRCAVRKRFCVLRKKRQLKTL